MKLELDLSDKAALRRIELELLDALMVVRVAIHGGNGNGNGSPVPNVTEMDGTHRFDGDPPAPVTSQKGFASDMAQIWQQLKPNLGEQFTTTDFIASGMAMGHPKGFMRKVLESLVLNNAVVETEAAAGRRPATFSKVNK